MILDQLRDAWIKAEEATSAKFKALMEATKGTREHQEFEAAKAAEKAAKDAYAKALRGEHNESNT